MGEINADSIELRDRFPGLLHSYTLQNGRAAIVKHSPGRVCLHLVEMHRLHRRSIRSVFPAEKCRELRRERNANNIGAPW